MSLLLRFLRPAASPSNTVAPVVSGTVTVGSTLTTTDGSWSGDEPITFTYQWQRDDTGGGSYSNITGATSSTYVLTTSDEECNIRAVVTGTNASGSASANSNAVGTVPWQANLGSDLPTVRVEIDFDNDPTSASRTWTNVTAYLRELETSRGRRDVLSRPDVGTLTLVLQNDDGRFDPSNTDSPYFPNVLPMRRIRVRTQWNNVIYNLFHGFIDDWPLSFPDLGKNATVSVTAIDGLAILSQFDLGGKSYAGQRTDVRSSAVLADCGFPASEMNLQIGASTVVASGTITVGTTAQSHLLDVSASENGLLFYDKGGTWQFHDRQYRTTDKSTSSGTVGTGSGMIGYRDIATSYGAAEIWNIISVTASGGTAEVTTNAASTASFFQRTLVWPTGGSYLVSSQAEALSAAEYIAQLYANPLLRVPEVVTVPAGATANWPTVLGMELSDRVTLSHERPDGGTILGEKHAEGIGHRILLDRDWATTLRLSDAGAQSYWSLGDADLSLLGETTFLTY